MNELQALPIHTSNSFWVTLVIFTCLLALVVVKVAFPDRFVMFVALPFESRYFSLKKTEYRLSHPFNSVLFIFNGLVIGLLCVLLLRDYRPDLLLREFIAFIQIALAFALLMGIKYLVEKMVANLFSMDGIIDRYLYYKFSHRYFLSFLLFPFCVISYYTNFINGTALLYIAIILAIFNVFFTVKFYIKNANLVTHNLFYFIFYLCALEIAPYLILFKVLIMMH